MVQDANHTNNTKVSAMHYTLNARYLYAARANNTYGGIWMWWTNCG